MRYVWHAIVWGVVGVAAVVGLFFLWTGAYSTYDQVVPLDDSFEKDVTARYPNIEFSRPKGLNISVLQENGDSNVHLAATPDLFMGLLNGDERISVIIQGGNRSDVVERLYIAEVEPSQKFVVYKQIYNEHASSVHWEVVGMPDNEAKGEIVFRYNNGTSLGFATFGVALLAFVVGAIGSTISENNWKNKKIKESINKSEESSSKIEEESSL